ncbi:helix-turn-helix domain-containing protein [Ruegeria lacuscaerulensis]|uniref:helix-turn-helix domain-containing protein n=1 Tax=Ruegeria lacuscaerulensis TaxID=55218 RepID=UPI00147D2A96|nr:helix-turn-helix domain-containing protein [Ruegeria lacuscaerulensis]
MGFETRSFEVYGFKIDVHAGGRRVWPPSFKRFINEKMDCGKLSVREIMKTFNVSQSQVYKWRSDVQHAGRMTTDLWEERVFSEIVVQENPVEPDVPSEIVLRSNKLKITVPAYHPVSNLISLIQALS